MKKHSWGRKNLIIFTAKHFQIIRLHKEDDASKYEILFESDWRSGNLGETLHIFKSENDFKETNLILPDNMFEIYPVELSKKDINGNLEKYVFEFLKTQLGHAPEDWSFDVVKRKSGITFVLIYVALGNKFEVIKNAFKLSKIEVLSIVPRVLYDYYVKPEIKTDISESNDKVSDLSNIIDQKHLEIDENNQSESDVSNLDKVSKKVDEKPKIWSILHLEGNHVLSPWMFIIFCFVVLLAVTLVYGFFSIRETIQSNEPVEIQPTLSITPSQTPTPTPNVFPTGQITQISDVGIIVQASTQQEGQYVENILLAAGALGVEIEILSSDTDEVTYMRVGDSVSDELVKNLLSILESEYEVAEEKTQSEQYDIVITVGLRRADL